MQTLKRDDLAFLAIVGNPDLTRQAIRLYSQGTVLFNKLYSPLLYTMWDGYLSVLKSHSKELRFKLSRDMITAGIAEHLQKDTNMPDELIEKSDVILKRLIIGEFPTSTEGAELLKYLIQLDANRKISSQVTMNAGIEELQRTLDKTKRTMDEIGSTQQTQSKVLFNPFSEIEDLAVKADRIPTGINWLDVASNGGGRAGELWLILGSSGGGKTVSAVQYSCAQALMGNCTLWATYEQSVQGDLAERMIANVTDTSLDLIRDKGFNNLSEDIKTKFWAAVSGVSDKLKVLDMTHATLDPSDPSDNGGMYTVWKYIKELKEQGTPVKSVIIDWVGAMMSVVGAITGKDISNGYRFYTQAEIDIARKIVKEEDVQIIFFHQSSSIAQHAKPTYIADKTDAKDMKDMCNYFDLVFTIGNRDKNNICYFNAAKSRKGKAICQTLQLVGDKSKFIMAPGWLPNRDGNFYKPTDDYNADEDVQPNQVPNFSREID